MLARVREMAATRCTGWGLLEFNGEADHVHLLVALPPNLDLSRFVNNLKTTSSRLLRKEFADRLKAGLSQARILVPLVLYHHLWRGAAIDPETVHRATTEPRISAPFTSSQAQGALCLAHWALKAVAGAFDGPWPVGKDRISTSLSAPTRQEVAGRGSFAPADRNGCAADADQVSAPDA